MDCFIDLLNISELVVLMQGMLPKKILSYKRNLIEFFLKLIVLLLIVFFIKQNFVRFTNATFTFNKFPLKRKHCTHAY